MGDAGFEWEHAGVSLWMSLRAWAVVVLWIICVGVDNGVWMVRGDEVWKGRRLRRMMDGREGIWKGVRFRSGGGRGKGYGGWMDGMDGRVIVSASPAEGGGDLQFLFLL